MPQPVTFDDLIPQPKQGGPVVLSKDAQLLDAFSAQQPVTFDDLIPQQQAMPQAAAPQLSRMENYRNATTNRLAEAGTGILGLAADFFLPESLPGQPQGVPGPRDAFKGVASEARKGPVANAPTQPGVERWIGENITGNPAMFIGGGPVTSAAASGGLDAVLRADPAASVAEKMTAGGEGATIGATTGYLVGKIAKPFKNALKPEEQRLVEILSDEGVKLNAAQKTGSKTLQLAGAAFDDLPFTGTMQNAQRDKQLQQFTAAALRKAGIEASEATPEVMKEGFKKIGGGIGGITRNATVKVDDQMMADVLAAVDNHAEVLAATKTDNLFNFYADDWTKRGSISGETYQNIRTRLGNTIKGLWSKDPDQAIALRDLLDTLDDAMMRSLPADKAQELGKLRGQYSNLLTISDSLAGAGKNNLAGQVSPNQLRSAVARGNKRGYVTGMGDLNDLARAGASVLTEPLANSQTAARTNMQKLLQLQMPATAGGAGGFMMGGPAGALMGAGTMLGAPVAMKAIGGTRPMQAYLSGGLPINAGSQALLARILAGQMNAELAGAGQ